MLRNPVFLKNITISERRASSQFSDESGYDSKAESMKKLEEALRAKEEALKIREKALQAWEKEVEGETFYYFV